MTRSAYRGRHAACAPRPLFGGYFHVMFVDVAGGIRAAGRRGGQGDRGNGHLGWGHLHPMDIKKVRGVREGVRRSRNRT